MKGRKFAAVSMEAVKELKAYFSVELIIKDESIISQSYALIE